MNCGVTFDEIAAFLPLIEDQKAPAAKQHMISFFQKIVITADIKAVGTFKVQIEDIILKYINDRDPKLRDQCC